MRLMLTSFGIVGEAGEFLGTHSAFSRMPPFNPRISNSVFLPDYAALLLSDQVIMDETSFRSLVKRPHPIYSRMAGAIDVLHKEGFVELVDFNAILRDNRALLQRMTENDLSSPQQWRSTLLESLHIWSQIARVAFPSVLQQLYGDGVTTDPDFVDRLLRGGWVRLRGYDSYPDEFDENVIISATLLDQLTHQASEYDLDSKSAKQYAWGLYVYLAYVNANIIVSNILDVGFHDWADFLPFYKKKFLSVGQTKVNSEDEIQVARQLFEVAFPEFVIEDPITLVKVLRDKRISDLRRLVEKAANEEVVFDGEFARNVFKEVFQLEQESTRYRNIVSYATLPLDFIPWVGTIVQKGAEEAVGSVLDAKLKRKYRWFYLLSDIVGKQRHRLTTSASWRK